MERTGSEIQAGPGYSRANWFFWSDWEKENVAKYQHPRYTPFGATRILAPVMDLIAQMVPEQVAPNVLTIAGLMCLLHSLYIAYTHAEEHPTLAAVACSALVSAYYVFDYIDGVHAARIRNETNLGALLVSAVNACSPTLLALIMCLCLGVRNVQTQWYVVQSAALFFLFIHIRELHGRSRTSVRLFIPGPAAVVPAIPVLMTIRAALVMGFGEDLITMASEHWSDLAKIVAEWSDQYPQFGTGTIQLPLRAGEQEFHRGAQTMYLFILVGVLTAVFLIPAATGPTDPRGSRLRILICVVYRMLPATMINLGLWKGVSLVTVLVDGLFIGVLITDLVVCKMARRPLHPWIVIMTMMSVIDQFLELMLCGFYFLSVFWDISEHMQLPIFTVVRNVYVDGVYDLCHIGHKRVFEAAAKFGNGLVVGVVNDEDATPYKRKPVMSHEERCREVAACKYVTRVVPNAPCNGIPEEFIKQHNIHVVVCGQEYFDNPQDKYYCVPRKMGILQAAPRTKGMSTSELIARVRSAGDEDLVAKDKLRGESTVTDEPGGRGPSPLHGL